MSKTLLCDITYLIDQQVSQSLLISRNDDPKAAQPLELETVTWMLDRKNHLISLSKKQAEALGTMLLRAAEDLPEISRHVEHPGYVISVAGVLTKPEDRLRFNE